MLSRNLWVGCLVLAHLSGAVSVAQDTEGLMYPDLIPFVDESRPYLGNWDRQGDVLRIQSVFANVGDGVFEIRRSDDPPSNGRFDVLQRVYDTSDPFGNPTDFFANTAVYHGGHGHIHFEDMSDFELLEVTTDGGVLGFGNVLAGVTKVSTNLHDITSLGITDRWGDFTGYPSFDGGNAGLRQIVSVGYGDVYNYGTSGQSFSIAGIPEGPYYWLRQTVDPSDVIRETDNTNNSFAVLIDLTRPGQTFFKDDGSFIQAGDAEDELPAIYGDLNDDRMINVNDWLVFRHWLGADVPNIADLNEDGRTNHPDFIIFQDIFDNHNGSGAFQVMLANIPEPSGCSLGLASLLGLTMLGRRMGLHRQR